MCNVIIDAQSFPFQSMSNPKLSKYGAYSTQSVYIIDDTKSIVPLGKELGIRVIPEFDTPGHTEILSFSEPNLMQCDAVNDNTRSMCPEQQLNVLNEDEYFRLSGDEIDPLCWGDNKKDFMKLGYKMLVVIYAKWHFTKKSIILSNSANISFAMKQL